MSRVHNKELVFAVAPTRRRCVDTVEDASRRSPRLRSEGPAVRAIQVSDFGHDPKIVEVSAPTPGPTDAIVRVRATGVCGSDWHAWQGHDDSVRLPFTPGHEFAGEIVSIGSAVTRVHPGDRVTSPFIFACGECEECVAGQTQVCSRQEQPGFTLPGSFADLVLVQRADLNLVPLPDAVDDVTAASLGCRFATAYRAVRTVGRVRAGETVAVFGCGGVGLSAIIVAKAAGARVLAVDVSPAALEKAAELGAEPIVSGDATVDDVRSRTGGGVHLGIDAFGSATTCLRSIESLRPRGRHVQVGLLLGAESAPRIPMGRVIANELEVLGSHGISVAEYPALLAEVASGALDPIKTLGRIIGFDDLPAALSSMRSTSTVAGMTVAALP